MATSIADLAINLTTNVASLQTGMNRAVEIANSTSRQINDAFKTVSNTLKTLGAGITLHEVVQSIKSVIDYADKLNDLSKQTGIAVETLGGLGYAAKTAGVDLDTVTKGTVKLSRAMAEAAGGNEQLTELFQRMGVDIKDATGALRPLDSVLSDVATKFASYKDGPEKAALATELFGKTGANLIPLLDEGGAKLRQLVEEYQKYGGVTTETAQRADAFNDALEKVNLINGSLVRTIASALLPTLQAIANVFIEAKGKASDFGGAADAVVVAVKALAIAGVGVIAAFQAVGKSIGSVFAALTLAIQGDFKGALGVLKLGFTDVSEVIGTAMTRSATIWNASVATIPVETEKAANKTTAPLKRIGQAAEEATFNLTKFLKPFTDYIAELGKAGAALDAQLAYLQRYGVELKTTAAVTAEFELSQGKLADRFTALSFLFPQIAESVRFITIREAEHNDEVRNSIDLEKQYFDAIRQRAEALANDLNSLDRAIEQEQRRADSIGKTRAEVIALDIAEAQHALDLALEASAYADVSVEVAALTSKIEKLRNLQGKVNVTDSIEGQFRDLQSLFNTLDSTARSIFDSIGEKGANMWEKIKESGKKILLDFLYSLTLKPFLITIAATLTGVSGNAAANTIGGAGGGNPLSALFNSGGNSLLQSAGNFLFGAGSAGAAAAGAGVSAGLSTMNIALGAGAEAVGGFSAVLGAAAAVAGPFIPLLAAAIPLLSGLLDKKPSEVRGQFQIGGANFEDNVSTATRFGNIGFADAGTQQFSGEAAQAFNKIVAGALDAFDQRYSAEQRDRLTEILSKTTFAQESGTFTTQDFLQKYGGQVLQQVVAAAFDVLDPALGAVARQFSGTADEIARFGNTLLAVYDATKQIGNADFTAGIDQALAGATQESADKVLAFVSVITTFGSSIEGLGATLQALDPTKITEFVDALGGAQKFAATFATFNQNFGTQAQTTANATTRLTDAFGGLGIAVPTTHADFVRIVEDFIRMGNTDAAQAVLDVSDAFITLHGTAEQVRQALEQAAQAGRDYYTSKFLNPDEQLLNRQTIDSTKIYEATRAGTQLGDVLHDLGVNEIPTTVDGVRDLVNATVAKYGADSDEAKALFALIPIIGDLIDSVGGFGDAATEAADEVASATSVIIGSVGDIIKQAHSLADTLLGQFSNLAGESTGDFGAKLALQISLINNAIAGADRTDFTSTTAFNAFVGELQASANNLTTDLARFTQLSVQFDATRAEQLVGLEQWYREQRAIFGGNAIDGQIASLEKLRDTYQRFGQLDLVAKVNEQIAAIQASGGPALDALKVIFDQKWDAIVNGAVAAAQSLDDFIKSIQQIADSTGGNAGQQAQLEQALLKPRLAALQTQYAGLDPTSALAKSILADITKLQTYNTALATQIAHFTAYTGQYGQDAAEKLVQLEAQFDAWRAQVGDNADALAVLQTIFDDKWKEIIDGIGNGVDGSLGELDRLRSGIADYLKGLVISDLSPLSPTERLQEAQAAYVDELMKAQSGDLTALGDITRFADAYLNQASDFYSSSQAFVDIFDSVRAQLAELAQTQPDGLPIPGADPNESTVAALASALPSDGKMASSTDVETQTKALEDHLTEMASSTVESQEAAAAATNDLLRRILDALNRLTTTPR